MEKIFFLLTFFITIHSSLQANASLPIDTLNSSDASKPLVLYITGDGGFNSFSTSFMQEWNRKGYPVVALNAKSYFWKTKTPDVAATDIANLIVQYAQRWKRSEVVLIGYSLGADVLPFIQTRLPVSILARLQHSILLSPSNSTDFTVHLFYSSGGSDVPAEINKLTKPVLIVFGKDEDNVPDKKINNKEVTIIKVEGDHHYNNQVPFLVTEMIRRL